jgi:glycosyltransferase involved in cell wall biosynthesis
VGLEHKLEPAAFVVTNTRYNASELVRFLSASGRRRLHVIYNGIDRWRWSGSRRVRSATGFRLLSVGRLIPQKGHHVLLEACALLRARGLEVGLDIVGGPELPRAREYQQALRDLHDRLDLGLAVRFLGEQPWTEVLRAYAAADLFVLPCIIDPDGSRDIIPNSLIEAMAAGLPVVSTPITGIPELVDHGTDGWLVPPDDARSLADAIAVLHAAPDVRGRLGRNAVRKVAERFDSDHNCADRAALFRTVLTGVSA